jgi:3',5'-cyclic AMP phosphodiesterase CpdA
MSNRRKFITSLPILSASVGLGLSSSPAHSSVFHNHKKRNLRLAHLTDIHVQPGDKAPKGMAAAFKKAQTLTDKLDLILNGGDCIMDSLHRTKDNVKAQWDVWQAVLKNELSLEMHSCIGNHDVWGWSNVGNKKKNDPLYGKAWATEELKLPNRYYSFAKANWHFIVLDSTHPRPVAGYWARLDNKQMEWLKQELASVPKDKFVCILSHIPILGVCTFFDGENLKGNNWTIPGAWMHQDAKQLKDLFYQYPNVKVCLSGHIHLVDEAEYLGVKYYCNGAVSGAWWGGKNQEFPPAFAVINLYEDGSSDREMVWYE